MHSSDSYSKTRANGRSRCPGTAYLQVSFTVCNRRMPPVSASQVLLLKSHQELRTRFESCKDNAISQGSCLLTRIVPTKIGGYAQTSIQHDKRQVKVCLHVLSAFVRFRRLPGEGEDVSHLCGNARCFNPDHLLIESKANNQRRKNCKVSVACPCCNTFVNVCDHIPSCIKSV